MSYTSERITHALRQDQALVTVAAYALLLHRAVTLVLVGHHRRPQPRAAAVLVHHGEAVDTPKARAAWGQHILIRDLKSIPCTACQYSGQRTGKGDGAHGQRVIIRNVHGIMRCANPHSSTGCDYFSQAIMPMVWETRPYMHRQPHIHTCTHTLVHACKLHRHTCTGSRTYTCTHTLVHACKLHRHGVCICTHSSHIHTSAPCLPSARRRGRSAAAVIAWQTCGVGTRCAHGGQPGAASARPSQTPGARSSPGDRTGSCVVIGARCLKQLCHCSPFKSILCLALD